MPLGFLLEILMGKSRLSTSLTSGPALKKSIMAGVVTIVELVTFLGIVALACLALRQRNSHLLLFDVECNDIESSLK